MIRAFVKQVKQGKINLVEHTTTALEEAQKINDEYRFITAWADPVEQAERLQQRIDAGDTSGKLLGVLVTVKDGICVKGIDSTASSAILKGYKPVFNATVVQRCIDEGAIILGKTVQDEFGFGQFCTNTGIGIPKPLNPLDKKRATGGSSGGAAGCAKAFTFPHVAIGESTGGSIVTPASFCGAIGICPTYGRVSRYGLIDYANSLDKIGPLANNLEDAALLLEVIAGSDDQDSTSAEKLVDTYSDVPGAVQGLRIGIVKEAFTESMDNNVRKQVLEAVSKLEQHGARKIELSLPLSIEHGIPTYFVLSTAEASTNLAKYCGLRYGATDQLTGTYSEFFSRVRNNNFGEEAKRRLLMGTFARMAGYRDAFYNKAAQVRTKIIEEYTKAFETVDVLITPTVPMIAPTFDQIKTMSELEKYNADLLTVAPNLAGLPHLTLPIGEHNNMPIGMMIIGPHFSESKIIQVANAYGQ